jgi:hypothetical protein
MNWFEAWWPDVLMTIVLVYRLFFMKPPVDARPDWKRLNAARSLQLWAIFVAATILLPKVFAHSH